jgi:potassium/hydrogen antiporter
VGMIVMVGVAGRNLQTSRKIPESIFLICLGLLIGPILGLVSAESLLPFVPLISTLALIGILLESGLEFEAKRITTQVRQSLALITLVALFTTISTGLFLHIFFGWDLSVGLLMGLICSGTTTLTAKVLLDTTKAHPHVRDILVLESIFNDITLILGTTILLAFISKSGLAIDEAARSLFSQISVALVLGAIAGVAWKPIAQKLAQSTNLAYISTLGFCFILYTTSGLVGGDPILSIFAFAVVFGNYSYIHKHFKKSKNLPDTIYTDIQRVQGSFTFFMRAFFFFVLGAIFSFSLLQPYVLLIVSGIIFMILLSRFLSVSIVSFWDKILSEHKTIVTIMIPRGFVATVLSFIPAQKGVFIPNLTEIVLLTVFASTGVAIFGTYLYNIFSKKSKRKK